MSYWFRADGVVVDGPPPLGQIDVPLQPGAVVLYGLNGAGKTRLLRAVTSLCAGQPSGNGYIYGSFEGEADTDVVSPILDGFVASRHQRRTLGVYTSSSHPEWEHPTKTLDPLWASVGAILWDRLPSNADPLAVAEAVDQGTFLLLPTGNSRPGYFHQEFEYDVEIGVRLDGSCPRLEEELRCIVNLVGGWTDTAEGVEYEPMVGALPSLWSLALDSVQRTAKPYWEVDEASRLLRSWLDAGPRPVRLSFYDPATGPVAKVWLEPPPTVSDERLTAESVEKLTLDVVSQLASHLEDSSMDSIEEVLELLETRCHELSTEASELLFDVRPDLGRLRCKVAPLTQWLKAPPVAWVLEEPTGGSRSISELSFSGERLAALAIGLALRPEWEDLAQCLHFPHLIAVDEPEAGLHMQAVRTVAEGMMERWGPHEGGRHEMLLLATHSPEFLGHPAAQLMHVFRSFEATAASRVDLSTVGRADVMGLSRTDLLLLCRVLLVVEGRHDEVIIKELLGPELANMGVVIVPLHGGRLLPTTVDARLVADYLDAPVVALLDNVNRQRVEALWAGLSTAPPEPPEAIDQLVKSVWGKSPEDEDVFVINLARRLHEIGQLDRFEVFGLAKKDLPMYLPVDCIVPRGSGWDHLWNDHQQRRAAGTKNVPRDFKTWLVKAHGADFSDTTLKAACNQLDHIPSEFTDLLERCRSMTRRAQKIRN